MTKFYYNNFLIYQLYLPSFGKSFKEIINLVDYFIKLKVQYIWFSPIFPHGGKDGGYDVIDYYNINKLYGSLEDFKELINIFHDNGIKILIDIIPNHTSIKHEWFIDSKNNKSNKRNWYIWSKKKNLPNNWYSYFEKSPWTYDKLSDSYYYHHFYKEQPDLNFWNIDVQNEIKKIFFYWLDLGIDGFRIDAVGCLFSDKDLKNNPNVPVNKDGILPRHLERRSQLNNPETFKFLECLIKEIKNKYTDIIILGETEFHTSEDKLILSKILDLSMNYQWAYINEINGNKFLKETLKWNNLYRSIKKDPLYFLYNHDESRGRYGENKNINIRKLLFILLHCMPGYKIMYYGEELGMSDGDNSNIDIFGRDKFRSPFPWNEDFKIDNWITSHPKQKSINFERQSKYDNSYYNWVKRILMILYDKNSCKFKIQKFENILIIYRKEIKIILNFGSKFLININKDNIIDSNLYDGLILDKYGFILKKKIKK